MTTPTEISYDELPYTSLPFAQTQPERLAALATLFGLAPPPLDRCRVLELGCASAGNLIPMAITMPGAQFVGVDLSDAQISDGRTIAGALALANVDLRAMSITDIDASFGAFDYIIAHGVYSWVPDAVQRRLLEVCAAQLAPNGIAFVSYNTLPGWHIRGVVRDIMRYHATQFAEPLAKVQQARAIAEFLAKNVSADAAYRSLVSSHIEALRAEPDAYIAHEHLEPTNQPLYFHEFIQRVEAHRLQYLADADFGTMLATNFAPGAAQELMRLAPGFVRQEQYMDFLRNRMFRQSLLVHDDQPVKRKIIPERLRSLHVSGSFEAVAADPQQQSPGVSTFRGAGGARMQTANAVTKAAIEILTERWPRAVAFCDLFNDAAARLRESGVAFDANADAERFVASDMLRCFGAGMVQLHARPSPYAAAPFDPPLASPLARLQAKRALRVTNLRHEPVDLNADLARLMQILDGTRSRAEIARTATEWAIDNAALTGKAIPRDAHVFIGRVVDQALEQLAKSALLMQAA